MPRRRTEPPAARGRGGPDSEGRPLAWLAAAALVVATALLLVPPWRPLPFSVRIDSSWELLLHDAFARGWRAGVDVVFTYGPLGFLGARRFLPATFDALLIGWGLFATLWACGVVAAARALGLRPLGAALWGAALVAISAVGSEQEGAIACGAAVLLVVVRFARCTGEDGRARAAATAAEIALGALVGALLLVKLSWGVAGVTPLAALALDDLARRSAPRALLAGLAGAAAGWLIAGQAPADFAPWLRRSLALAAAYGEAMSLPGSIGELALAVLAALCALIATVALARPGRGRWLAALAAAGVLASLLKAGFVRPDGHQRIFASGILAIGWVLLAPAARAAGRSRAAPRWRAALAPLALVAALGASVVLAVGGAAGPLGPAARLARRAIDAPAAIARALGDRGELRRELEAYLAGERRRKSVDEAALVGPADAMPYETATVFAAALERAPRPLLQSYAAVTPELLELDAAHLRGPRAPETILFDPSGIDGRLPALEDGLSWLELLARYDVVGRHGDLVLRRRAQPRGEALEPVAILRGRIGERIALPAAGAGALWARLRVERSALGTLVAAAWKLAPPAIELETASGQTRKFRLMRGAAAAGFLLSPLVDGQEAYAALAAGEAGGVDPPVAVRAVRVAVEPGEGWAWRPAVELELLRLTIGG